MITRQNKLLAVALLVFGLTGFGSVLAADKAGTEDRKDIAETLSKPEVRGGIVFKNYCALCHGEAADGSGRASNLYPGLRTRITPQTEKYYHTVILGGGPAGGLSEFMPPWKDELSQEQIHDVLAYLKIVTNTVTRGEVVFKTNCILCHGIHADGKGRAAKMYDPPPANLTKSDKNTDYKKMIVTYGGEAMGRSKFMPVWGEQLSVQEISDVVDYIDTLVVK